MITQLSIKNFKAHKDVTLSSLGRINLLLGHNNAGKSAALEALLYVLLPDNPKAVFELLNHSRRIQPGPGVWKSVFHRLEFGTPVEIQVISSGQSSTVRILPTMGNKPIIEEAGGLRREAPGTAPDGLLFEYVSANKRPTSVSVSSHRSRLEQAKNKRFLEGAPAFFVPAREQFDAQTAASRFGALKVKRRHEPVLEALRLIEPNLVDVESLSNSAGLELFADTGQSELVPLSWMGDGMLRILGVASALTLVQGGCLLIDEVENGLHYSVMEGLWRVIAKTSRNVDAQVVVTTHSEEMWEAAVNAMRAENLLEDLRAFRFDRLAEGTRVTPYTGNLLLTAKESEQEVR